MKIFLAGLMATLLCSLSFAETVKLDFEGLTVSGNYIEGDADKPVFVILHATWQHHTNELPSYMQQLLDFEGYSSLAFSLSLGLDDRQLAINCDETPTVLGTHQQALDELNLWFDWLAEQGHERFILVGHSRGGAQSALFQAQVQYPGVEQLILIAPATFDYERTAQQFENNFRVPLADQIDYFKGLENQIDPITESALLYCFYANTSAETFLSYYEPEPEKHTPAILTQVDIPTKVFLGTDDDLSHRFIAYEDEFMTKDNVSIYWIEGAGHFFRDLYTDDIVEEVLYGDN